MVRALISNVLSTFFNTLIQTILENSKYEKYISRTRSLTRKLECNSTLSYIENRCLLKLIDNEFIYKLLSDLMILPFINGYIDLNTKTFHKYSDDQYITITFPFN